MDQSGLFDVEQRAVAEREVMLELQRALLPSALPVLPDVDLAAAYRAADQLESAGGDWFDAVAMPAGRFGLVVGDVVGHGPPACAVMGQLRTVAAEALQRGSELEEVLAALDAFADSVPDGRGGTVTMAVLDRGTGLLRYAVRGQSAPLVVSADGVPRFLLGAGGPPLAFRGKGFRVAEDTLAAGETLVLYTDGVVVRPQRTLGQGIADLAALVAQVAARTPERAVAEEICASVTAGGDTGRDDICVLTATMLPARPEPLHVSVPANAEELVGVRKRISDWLANFQVSEDDQVALELSVVEAVTNSIEHAFTGPPGLVSVDAVLDDGGTVGVVISDDGRWKPPAENPGFRGRGLMMMREFSDTFRLDTSNSGTTVTLAKALHRPVPMNGHVPVGPDWPRAALEVDVAVEPAAVIVSLTGVLDSSSVERLRASLLDVERMGALPLVIVLDGLTLLASIGLRILFEHAGRLLSERRTLRLVVADSSPVRDVLAISGLDQLVQVSPRM